MDQERRTRVNQSQNDLKVWAANERINLASRDLERAREALLELDRDIVRTSGAIGHLTRALGAAQLAADDLASLLDKQPADEP